MQAEEVGAAQRASGEPGAVGDHRTTSNEQWPSRLLRIQVPPHACKHVLVTNLQQCSKPQELYQN